MGAGDWGKAMKKKRGLRKVLSAVTALVLATTAFCSTTLAAELGDRTEMSSADPSARMLENVWDGSVASAFAEGDGTEESPYVITNGSELALLARIYAERDRTTNGRYYALGADIWLNDTSNFDSWDLAPPENSWDPIGVCTISWHEND